MRTIFSLSPDVTDPTAHCQTLCGFTFSTDQFTPTVRRLQYSEAGTVFRETTEPPGRPRQLTGPEADGV